MTSTIRLASVLDLPTHHGSYSYPSYRSPPKNPLLQKCSRRGLPPPANWSSWPGATSPRRSGSRSRPQESPEPISGPRPDMGCMAHSPKICSPLVWSRILRRTPTESDPIPDSIKNRLGTANRTGEPVHVYLGRESDFGSRDDGMTVRRAAWSAILSHVARTASSPNNVSMISTGRQQTTEAPGMLLNRSRPTMTNCWVSSSCAPCRWLRMGFVGRSRLCMMALAVALACHLSENSAVPDSWLLGIAVRACCWFPNVPHIETCTTMLGFWGILCHGWGNMWR